MDSIKNILHKLIYGVDSAKNLASALDILVSEVARVLSANVCSVYIVEEVEQVKQLRLNANIGFSAEIVGQVSLKIGEGLVGQIAERAEALNTENATLHKSFCAFSAIDENDCVSFLGVPIVEHGDVLGVLVVQKEHGAFSDESEAFLTTLASRLTHAILHAKNAGEIETKLEQAESSIELVGGAGSPGISKGEVVLLFDKDHIGSVQQKASRGISVETEVFDKAIATVISELKDQAEIMSKSLPEAEVALFTVYIQMLQNGPLVDDTYKVIEEGFWAPWAWRESIEAHASIFESMDDAYLAERAQDVRDLGKRVLLGMINSAEEMLVYPKNTILIGENISVSDLARVPDGALRGIVSGHGSKSSHVAILAHALGVPAVMGVHSLPTRGVEGRTIVVDGYSGHAYIDPHPTLFESLTDAINEDDLIHLNLVKLIENPAITTDGKEISVHVNSGLMADLSPKILSGADGIGLYRTEIPFQVRERFPSEAEQYELYKELLCKFNGKPVVLRTLDVGGDKPLSYFPIVEDNPFLGWRGVRITLDHPEIFITQVRAMLKANIAYKNLHILLPMITNQAELDDAIILIHRAKNELDEELNANLPVPKIGVMIEVPAAVYQIEELCKLVDFVSVGTNDLTQYLLAVDRNNENVAGLYSSLHPAVLKALKQVVEGAAKQSTPVSVCGEMAGDPLGMLLLLGLGIESLSMSAGSIGRVKQVIRHFSLKETQQLVQQSIALGDAGDIQDLLIAAINAKGLGGLIRAGN